MHARGGGRPEDAVLDTLNRRDFIGITAGGMALAAGPLPWLGAAPARAANPGGSIMSELGIDTLPNFCSHEHWGSISAIGPAPAEHGFRADTEAGASPQRRVRIWDLVLDPYAGGWMAATGVNPWGLGEAQGEPDFAAWWDRDPAAALDAIRPHLQRQLFTGVFQCVRRGLLYLHDIDIATLALDDWQAADAAVGKAYADIFAWYGKAMGEAGFSELIRPVHPEFYVRDETAEGAARERAFTNTILRIDPLLDLWKVDSPRRDTLADLAGVDPVDAASWRAFITKLFDIAAAGKTTGIKQLQAYSRTLRYDPVDDAAVTWRGELDAGEVKAFQDWVMHACCAQAHERGWPHQAHIGTHNILESSPMPLEPLARRYGRMDIVMIHCWPFIDEAGWLAKHVPNMYIDTCWQPVLNPAFLRKSLRTWMNYVPTHKIMLAHDSTSIEMAVGSSRFTREILAESLQSHGCGADPSLRRQAAADMLHNNAVRLYGIGETY